MNASFPPESVWVDRSPKIADCYHALTKGIPSFDLYETEEDFVIGMNMIGVLSRQFRVRVLASKLNDSHEHHVLHGSYEDCQSFLAQHVMHARKQLLYRKRKSGLDPLPQPSLELSVLPIETEHSLRSRIAYLIKNSFDAGLPLLPWWDPWSTAKVYFADYKMLLSHGKPMSEFGNRLEQRYLFHTNQRIPQEWRADERYLICPVWYTDYQTVNSLYRTPELFIRYLSSRKNAEEEEQIRRSITVEVSVQALRETSQSFALSRYGTKDLERLNEYQKIMICRDLQKQGATIAQLQRVVHIPSDRLRHLLR